MFFNSVVKLNFIFALFLGNRLQIHMLYRTRIQDA